MRLHVHHIKGKIIKGSPFSAARNNNQHAPIRLKFQFNKSLLSTEIELKIVFYMWTKRWFNLEKDSLVTSLALDKYLLTNQDLLITKSTLVIKKKCPPSQPISIQYVCPVCDKQKKSLHLSQSTFSNFAIYV